MSPAPITSGRNFVGAVLGAEGKPVGTCFQVSPGLLVTSRAVLEALDRNRPGAIVEVRAASAEAPIQAEVEKTDLGCDLAVLRAEGPFGRSAPAFAATDGTPVGAKVVVTGAAHDLEPGEDYAFLEVVGTWTGSTTRKDATGTSNLHLGRVTADQALRSMRGAPVQRTADGAVVGILSDRTRSAHRPLTRSAWVARTEDLKDLINPVFDSLPAPPIVFVRRPHPVSPPGDGRAVFQNLLAALLFIPLTWILENIFGKRPLISTAVPILLGFSLGFTVYIAMRMVFARSADHAVPRILWGARRLIIGRPDLIKSISGATTLLVLFCWFALSAYVQPRPIALYLFDQTRDAAAVDVDMDRVLSGLFDGAGSGTRLGLTVYGGSLSDSACRPEPFDLAVPISSSDSFRGRLPAKLAESLPGGNSSLEHAVLNALEYLNTLKGSRTLVIVTAGANEVCDDPRPRTTDDELFRLKGGVMVRVVEVRLQSLPPGDSRSAFVQYLAAGLRADYRVGASVADLRNALAPPTYFSPPFR
ncbi:MAG TPA: trypsin-like peptidase domain-containing protein [Egibacteraceae bacterium]|nr:trypsin-like peptidase domain-containing protein [Egibacteraceae bacterium]